MYWVHVDCMCIRAPVNMSNIVNQYSQRRLQSPKPLTTSLTTLTSNAHDWHQKVKTHDGKHPPKYVNGCKSFYIVQKVSYIYINKKNKYSYQHLYIYIPRTSSSRFNLVPAQRRDFTIAYAYAGSQWYNSSFYAPGCCSTAIWCSTRVTRHPKMLAAICLELNFTKLMILLKSFSIYLTSKHPNFYKSLRLMDEKSLPWFNVQSVAMLNPISQCHLRCRMVEARWRHCNMEVQPPDLCNPVHFCTSF